MKQVKKGKVKDTKLDGNTLGEYNSQQERNFGVGIILRPLLPHPSTYRNETRTGSSLPPRNLPIQVGTNPSTPRYP